MFVTKTKVACSSVRESLPRALRRFLAAGIMLLVPVGVLASTLENIEYNPLPGERVQLTFSLSEPVNGDPLSFTIDNPARIVLDFPNTKNKFKHLPLSVDVGVMRDVMAVEAMGRTRVVLNLDKMAAYETQIQGNNYIVTVSSPTATVAAAKPLIERAQPRLKSTPLSHYEGNRIENVDFRRGAQGEGQLVVKLSDPHSPVDVVEQDGKIVLDFKGVQLPEKLRRRLDVTDFATPVSTVDAKQVGNLARLEVAAGGKYEQMAYQYQDTFTLDVKAVKDEEKNRESGHRRVSFSGEKISLNFQDIEVRAVLQLIADFTGLNMVTTDSVQGNITLRLQNVPWDQALDIVLRTKGLGMRQTGNVIMVAPMQEIVEREKIELENMQDKEKLSPLETRRIRVNYVKATDIAKLLSDEKNPILTKERGSVQVFAPNNILIVKDTGENLSRIVGLVKELDQPVRQVLIESRIVIANNDFARELGARSGLTSVKTQGDNFIGTTGSSEGTDLMVDQAGSNQRTNGSYFPISPPQVPDSLNFNVPVAGNAGRIALAILNSNFLVNLELSAIQAEGRGEVISNPRVITANQKEALIEQGTEIPYQTVSVVGGVGGTTIEFKKAVLSLRVTPQITPDDRINLDLRVSKDSVGQIFNGVPSIDTKEVNTQVLVNNGETLVLGGIYEQVRREQEEKVPLLGDIPILGHLFKTSSKRDDKSELLIFVTPKIIKDMAVMKH